MTQVLHFIARYDNRSNFGRKLYARCIVFCRIRPAPVAICVSVCISVRLQGNECNLLLKQMK